MESVYNFTLFLLKKKLLYVLIDCTCGDEKSRLQGARDEGREEGRKEGKIEGKKEGIKQGAKDALAKSTIKLLRKKLKDIPENIIESILSLSLEKIEKINGDVFDIESLEDLKKYL